MPQFAVCPASSDDWLFGVGDFDVGGFGDGNCFIGEYSYTIVITGLTDGE